MASPLLDLHVDEADGICTVTCMGELDVFTREAFDAVVRPLARPGRSLVLDMRGVTFLDSSGVCSLLFAMRPYRDRPQELRVVPSRPISDLFRLTGLPFDHLEQPGEAPESVEPRAYPDSHWQAVLARAHERLDQAAQAGEG